MAAVFVSYVINFVLLIQDAKKERFYVSEQDLLVPKHMETIPRDMYPGVVELRQQLDKYKGTIYGDNGELLCEYRIFNDSVVDVEFGGNNKLPITTYTEDDYAIAEQKTADLMWIWTVLMTIECIAIVIVYSISRRKLIKN